jgi:hypothetical protein
MDQITRVPIAESDYDAIMQWENEGGTFVDFVYTVVPDLASDSNRPMDQKDVKVPKNRLIGQLTERATQPSLVG